MKANDQAAPAEPSGCTGQAPVRITRHAVQTLLRMPPGSIGMLFGPADAQCESRTLRVETLSPVTQITKPDQYARAPIGFWMCGDPADPPAIPARLTEAFPDARLRILVDPSTKGRLDAVAWLAPGRQPLELDMLEDAPPPRLSAEASDG